MATSFIQTDNLQIRQFDESFSTKRYVDWLNDRELTRYSQQRFRSHTLESCASYLASFAQTPHYFWAIVSKDQTLGHIGNINAYIDSNHSTADVGILLGERRAHGRGLATEAWQAVCQFLLSEQKIRKVTAGTLSCNLPMLSIMKKSGMVDDGRRRKHQICGDVPVDVIHMALFSTSR